MSGHSKWATIKHKKAKEDAKRGKLFTRIIKEITVAAREGGGDAAGNPRLRVLIDKAKHANMPQDNIIRAIKKGTGEIEGVVYEHITYEGYGPGGIAIMVDTLTDNKRRTVADVRHIFSKKGGNLAEAGAVGWMFERKAVVSVVAKDMSADDILEKMLDYPVEDIRMFEGAATIIGDSHDLTAIKEGAEKCKLEINEADIEWVPKDYMSLDDKEQEEKAYAFLEALEDIEDVQSVYTNLG